MSSDAQPQQRYIPPSRRRDKPILSCTLCRRRKLKCDRQQPCKACVDRGLSLSCTFSRNPQTPSSTGEAKAAHNVHDRIDQLEKLVTALMAERRNGNQESPGSTSTYSPKLSVGGADADIPGVPDRVKLETDETSYTNSGHWTSILDGIAELKDQLDQIPTTPQARDPTDEISGPDLLFSRTKHATLPEILAGLPSRSEADQLVVKYYAYMDMAPTLIHRPTFLRQYEQFWQNPTQVSVMWLGILFSVFAIATRFHSNVEEYYEDPDPSKMTAVSARMAFYREKVVQCLILGDYTKCPPYTLEVFLSYFVMEYLRSRDTQFGIWLLVGMLVRIALRMGYHREPSKFPNISPFQAEMRRRIWSMIVQLDLMSSIQVGLPRMIQPSMSDVMEPRNLTDADLDENMTELPPSRPESDSTVMLYTMVRNRGLQIMSRIVDLSNTGQTIAYREILELDKALRDYYNGVPDSLKGLDAKVFNAESDTEMRKMYLGVTFLKASVMLHRPYMLLGRTDARYEYSRMACLDAALEILDFQMLLDRESRVANKNWSSRWRLWTSNWRQSSLVNFDFLLATTVLLLDLDKDLASPMPVAPNDVPRVRFKSGQPTRTEIVEALKGTYPIWADACEKSREAVRVAAAMKLMLGKVDASNDQPEMSTASPSSTDPFAIFAQQQASDFSMGANTNSNFFALDNPHLSLPFPMADMPMDFGGSFDWGGMESEYSMPTFESSFQNPYYG
ncbi:hypothetical protein K458DRAFT_355288 [Lentithecium fluviatile CBS 122367]|uniref:Zn(2)-C6 fungal-type domain-containing protein n=1 Tax=Lentithecium fluviatile CBS 122367 TaxID=1168545 RepID=A0A6G1JK56_9PLEO|nr:hypothetical protein K458DRAFT_355288 [Lentithecium fluviatile CBS 122367]